MSKFKDMKLRYKVVLGAAVGGAALAGGGLAAFAYFSSTGTGTGSANVGNATAFTVGESGTPSGASALYPDTTIGTGNIETHSYTVTNPSKGNQNLNKVVVSIANSNGSTWSAQADPSKPACNASSFSVGGQAVGSSWTDTSLAGDFTTLQSKTGTVTIQMIDNNANQDNCQGVTVPLYLSAS